MYWSLVLLVLVVVDNVRLLCAFQRFLVSCIFEQKFPPAGYLHNASQYVITKESDFSRYVCTSSL